jgi:hypothetical protein
MHSPKFYAVGKIPPDQLPNLPLFGIDHLVDDGAFAWYRGERGRMRVEKADPRVFIEDVSDAIQLKAMAIFIDQ